MSVTINHQTNSVEPSSGDLSIGGSGNVSINNEAIVDGDVTIDNRNRLRFADSGVDKAFIGINQGKNLFMGSEGSSSDPRIRFNGETSQAEIVPCLPAGATTSGASGYLNLGSSIAGFKDLYLDGGVYLGGTGSANLLDDYEIGTWTPYIAGATGITYTVQNGTYVKVGDLVTLWWRIDHTGTMGGSNIRISGRPFYQYTHVTSMNIGTLGARSSINVGANDVFFPAMYDSGDAIYIYSTSFAALNYTSVWQAGSLSGTLTYRAN